MSEIPNWITQKVGTLTDDQLHAFNKAVNAKIAMQLTSGPSTPEIAPLADSLQGFTLGLGSGEREFEGIETGMTEFDRLIGGLNKFVIVGGRAGTGKTTLAVQLGLGAIATEQVPLIFYSFEMPKRDITVAMLQNLRREHDYRLTRKEIVLHGNKPISSESGAAIKAAMQGLQELAPYIYIIDSSLGQPDISRMNADITRVAQIHGKPPMVVIDSIQDLVQVGNAGATAAEVETAQAIVELQQATGAAFLAISQKAKGASIEDPYAGFLGSVSLMHKPTSVVDLASVYDLMRQIKDKSILRTYAKLADLSDVPNPVIATVLKGRNNGHGHINMKFYGRNGYFEVGKIHDFDANSETSIYDLLGL